MQSDVKTKGLANACVKLDNIEHICTKSDHGAANSPDWQFETLPFNKARFILTRKIMSHKLCT